MTFARFKTVLLHLSVSLTFALRLEYLMCSLVLYLNFTIIPTHVSGTCSVMESLDLIKTSGYEKI